MAASVSTEKEEIRNILHFLKLKNERPQEIERDQKFLSTAFEFLERHSECIWCQYTTICGELLRLFSFSDSPPLKWFKDQTVTCLTSCRNCIESYYGIRPKLFSSFRKIYDEATVNEFEGKIHLFDVKRLKEPFELYLTDRESRKKLPIKFILFEILLFPGWIISPELGQSFESVLEKIISSLKMVKISEKLPGVQVCSVHPNSIIREWAKLVLNSDIKSHSVSNNSEIKENNDDNTITYTRINYTWDTIVLLSQKLNDEAYTEAMYVCLKAGNLEFIKTCANWDWTGRIFSLLKKNEINSENSNSGNGFMEVLRLYGLLIKILSSDVQFKWNQIPDFFTTISLILDHSAFAFGNHTKDNDCAKFVLDWIPFAIRGYLFDKSFKLAHRIVSDLMEFVLESKSPFTWKLKVVVKFVDSLSSGNVSSPYLLSKICQLLLFLFDRRFLDSRKVEHENEIILCFETVFVSLVKFDLASEVETSRNEIIKMEGTPSSAVFDVSNYRKYLSIVEAHNISLTFLNSLAKEIYLIAIQTENAIDNRLWTKRIDLLTFLVKESAGQVEILRFSFELVSILIFIQMAGIKLNLSSSNSEIQQNLLIRIVENHPEKCLKGTSQVISIFLKHKYKMKEGVIPLEKTFYFLNFTIGKVFENDSEILNIYLERFELVLEFFMSVVVNFFLEINSFVSLPGGAVYYEMSLSICSFTITLFSMLNTESFYKYCAKALKPSQVSSKIVPCLGNFLMNILSRSNQSRYTDIPSLVNLSSKLIILCGYLSADFNSNDGKVDQIIKVLLTSNSILPAYKASISSAIQEYSRISDKKFNVPREPPKHNMNFIPANSKLDAGLAKKLEILERMDDEYINKQMSAPLNNNSGLTTLKPSSKLGLLRQEMVRDGAPATSVTSNSKKSRFTPILVQKAPRMMTQADLLRSRIDSSDSEADVEITSETFKNAPQKSSVPFTAQPHRSVKLIDIEDEKESTDRNHLGQPISSKATAAKMQRDWQCAQRLHRYILSLDYEGLNDSSLVEMAVQVIPDSFINYEKYFQIFEPLLQLECRSQIIQSKEESEGRLTYYRATVQSISMVDDFHEVVMNFGDDAVHRLFTEQDILVGHPVVPHQINSKAPIEILGLAIQTASRQSGFEVTLRFYLKRRATDADFQLLTRLKQHWKFAKLCNMVTSNREFLALQNLPLFSGCNRILQPKFSKIDSASKAQIERSAAFYTRVFGLNLSQASAIAYALINPNYFTLIQGPPGTGKTRTIEGFLSVLFGRPTGEIRIPIQLKRVLICAASNAAIDEIVRRLKGGIKDSYGHLISLKLVRVGSIEMIHEDVKNLSIDGIVESLIQNHIASAVEMLQSNRKQLNEIKEQLDKAESGDISEIEIDDDDEFEIEAVKMDKLTASRNKNNNFEAQLRGKSVQELKNQLWQVKENIRKGNKFIEDSRQNLRLKVLNEAQVICCTLSASGHEVISRIEGDFEMVIIDEACQAIELSSLIPLQYGCKRAVLIGDPNQLPPTVISQMAATFAYEQSLFQRLQKIDPSAVQLLSLQYRMHPDIAAFPSSYFYGGKLANGPTVLKENTRPWHDGTFKEVLGPFRFFDIPGQEQLRTFASGRQGNSMMNELEAKITSSLIALLSNSSPEYKFNGKIGIITPYKEQRRLISRELVHRFGPNILQSVEVSTVDGYQGQEKEIIIFSCVRTGEKSPGSIGFLNDSRRLNVAITRAKCSLFLLGKSSTLSQNPLWRSLIENSRERKMFLPFDGNFWQDKKKLAVLHNMC